MMLINAIAYKSHTQIGRALTPLSQKKTALNADLTCRYHYRAHILPFPIFRTVNL